MKRLSFLLPAAAAGFAQTVPGPSQPAPAGAGTPEIIVFCVLAGGIALTIGILWGIYNMRNKPKQ